MKRPASTLVLLAGLVGGGCASPSSQVQKPQPAPTGGFGTVTQGKQIGSVQGPLGEPVMATNARGTAPSGVQQAGGTGTLFGTGLNIRPASGLGPNQVTAADGCTNCLVPGVGGNVISDPNFALASGLGTPNPNTSPANTLYGPNMPYMPHKGIVPTPGMGPPGAVAAVGALPLGMGGPGMGRPCMVNGRSSINFTGPAGMKVTWQIPDGTFVPEKDGLTAPKDYNFLQGQVYRLRLTSILPDYPGRAFYPTLQVEPASQKTLTFLAHSSVPITFSPDDFAQAKAGNLVVKVVYLPDPANQDYSSTVGAEEVVSTRLEPGADPVAEAQRHGTILAVIRMGNIDLENTISPKMTDLPGAVPPGMPPGMLPGPRPVPAGPMPKNSGHDPLRTFDPLSPANPPGIATVKPPAVPPAATVGAVGERSGAAAGPRHRRCRPPPRRRYCRPWALTDLPPAPLGPLAPIAPGPKTK